MKNLLIVYMIFSIQVAFGSMQHHEPFDRVALRISASSDEVNQEMSMDDEQLCETAFQSFYPARYKERSFCVRPHFKRLLQELRGSPRRDEASSVVTYLKRVKSESSDRDDGSPGCAGPVDNPYDHEFPREVMRSDTRIQRMLIEAVHEALEEREALLEQREHDLRVQTYRLEKKMSKKYSAMMTTIISFCTACVSGITVYLSK